MESGVSVIENFLKDEGNKATMVSVLFVLFGHSINDEKIAEFKENLKGEYAGFMQGGDNLCVYDAVQEVIYIQLFEFFEASKNYIFEKCNTTNPNKIDFIFEQLLQNEDKRYEAFIVKTFEKYCESDKNAREVLNLLFETRIDRDKQ